VVTVAVHTPAYPVRVEGRLDPQLSRWLWLVKWLLAIPHAIVLAFLWIAFVFLSLFALAAIVFTERYPRSIFEFNVGVLRWTWRVAYYSYSALGTDRYPPFTLGEAPDYPATLSIDYPERLSRGLALVKWWLLAIPHYLVVAVFVGGGTYVTWQTTDGWESAGPGLVSVLVLIAAVALLFAGRYPRGIFDLVLGADRWVIRVAAYAALMTDAYPPFRLDLGGAEPGAVAVEPAPPGAPARRASTTPGTAARVLLATGGALAALAGVGLLGAGGFVLWADQTQRDASGYLMTPAEMYRTNTYALESETIELRLEGPDWLFADERLGTIRLTSENHADVFVGIARSADVAAYLDGVAHERVREVFADRDDYRLLPGGAPAGAPTEQTFWAASLRGSGDQELTWKVADGDWSIVLMNADGSAGVDSSLSVGAKLDGLGWLAVVLLGVGLALAALGSLLLFLGVRPRETG
jgi:hypothetical protein